MNRLLTRAVNRELIDDADIADALVDICDRTHASCDPDCPVYEKNQGIPWDEQVDNCLCFKNGRKMLKFLREEKA